MNKESPRNMEVSSRTPISAKPSRIRNVVKELIPPLFLELLRKIISKPTQPVQKGMWSGNYSAWRHAKNIADGYEKPEILEKTRQAILKVKHGEAVYERDSVIFDSPEYPWPLITCLLTIASNNKNRLHLIDFGGSLGSSYFHCRPFLNGLSVLKWNVVEQSHYVVCGRKEITDDQLDFYHSVNDALTDHPLSNVLLLSSVLHYLESPYNWIQNILKLNFEYILIDSTAFISDGDDRITLQNVPSSIYAASYPAWFFNRERFLNAFDGYCVLFEFDNGFNPPTQIDNQVNAYWQGFMLIKHDN